MSTTVSITSTYAGEVADKYISAAFLAAPTLGNQTISVKPNIKYKQVIRKMLVADVLAGATCDFSPVGTITLTERYLEPKKLQAELKLCKDDYISDWESMSMGFSALNDNLPKTFSDYLIGNVSASVAGSLEQAIWQGIGGANSISGLTTLFKLDAGVIDVSGTTITSSNVIAEIGKVIAAVAGTNIYLAGEKPVLYVATNIYFAYQVALGGFASVGGAGYKNEGPNQTFGDLYYAGIKLIETPGLPNGQMVCAQASNLFFGCGLMSDQSQINVIDQTPIDGSSNVNLVMKFTACVNFGIASEIVYYWIY